MVVIKVLLALCLVSVSFSSPVNFTQEAKADSEEYEDDPFGYFAEQASSLFEDFLKDDSNAKVSEDTNLDTDESDESDEEEVAARSERSLEDKIEDYVKTQEMSLELPFGTLQVGAKNLENDEMDIKFKFGDKTEVAEARKHKLKKILSPIVVFFLLKAITVVPLAIGFLLLKAWNALQLSVFSFVISAGLAIFQLCKKIAENNAAAHIAAHGPWETSGHSAAARNFDVKNDKAEDAQNMAYSAYVR